MNDDDIERRVTHLVDGHRRFTRFEPFSGALALASLDEAYAVQRAYVQDLIASQHTRLAGYKIGLTSPRMQALCGIDSPIAGRVLANRVLGDGVTLRRRDFGRLGIEFEIAVRIGRALPPEGAPYAFANVATAVSAVAPAVEVVDDRNAEYQGLDMASLVADNSWNAGLILGAWRTCWPDLAELPGRVSRNGEFFDEGHGRDVLGHPAHALTWLANHLAAHGEGLRAGDVVATGSLVPTQFPSGPEHWHYRLGGMGELDFQVID
ncbi:MAG: 2-keto-4-pentenoate hydratase [Gammaproteobacteria bacterium]